MKNIAINRGRARKPGTVGDLEVEVAALELTGAGVAGIDAVVIDVAGIYVAEIGVTGVYVTGTDVA